MSPLLNHYTFADCAARIAEGKRMGKLANRTYVAHPTDPRNGQVERDVIEVTHNRTHFASLWDDGVVELHLPVQDEMRRVLLDRMNRVVPPLITLLWRGNQLFAHVKGEETPLPFGYTVEFHPEGTFTTSPVQVPTP